MCLQNIRDFHSLPLPLQPFRRQPPMAVIRFLLAAEQAGPVKCFGLQQLFHLPFLKQLQVGGFVFLPGDFAVPVAVHQFLRGGQLGKVFVFDAGDHLQEIFQVVLLREARELGDVAQADVDDLPHPVLHQGREELLRALARKPDREQLHHPSPPVTQV